MKEEGNKTQPGTVTPTPIPQQTEEVVVPGFTGPIAIFALLGVLLLVSKVKRSKVR